MSISDCKVLDEQISAKGVCAEPGDRLTRTAAENKAIFDRLVKDVVAKSMNDLVEALESETAASELGAEDPMNSGSKTVQQILNAFKQYVDELKAENIAALMLDGETKSTVQGVINEIAQKLEQQIGTEQLENKAVTTDKIAEGSVTLEKLAEKVIEKMNEAEAFAKGTADGISVPERTEDNARYYKEKAETSKEFAEAAKEDAESALAETRIACGNAQDAASSAGKFSTEALTAKSEAEAARDRAEAYARGAVNSVPVVEGEPGFKDNAKYYKDEAEKIHKQLLTDLNAHRYDAFPTTTLLGKFAAYTDLGAGDIPLARLIVKRDYRGNHHTSVTVRRVGKNLFNPSLDEFAVGRRINKDGSTSDDSTVAHSKNYTPVLPNTDYVFSGRVNSSAKRTYVAFYDSQRKFLSRYDPGYTGPCHFKTPGDCHFIRYNARSNTNFYKEVQLEMGTVATDFEAYSAEDFTLRFVQNGEWRTVDYAEADLLAGTVGSVKLDAPLDVRTMRGANYFYVLNGTREEDIDGDVNTLDAELRIDQSLIYEKLKTAIVAAGSI